MSFSIEFIVLKRKRLNKGKGVGREGWKGDFEEDF
jgi:hypothetical protein